MQVEISVMQLAYKREKEEWQHVHAGNGPSGLTYVPDEVLNELTRRFQVELGERQRIRHIVANAPRER